MWLSPSACDHCLRALEKAEENAQRLTGKPGQVLPHPELCAVRKDLHQNCPHCQVSIPGEYTWKDAGGEALAEVLCEYHEQVTAPESHNVGEDIQKTQLLLHLCPPYPSPAL